MATHLSRRWIRRAGAPLALLLLGACGGGATAGAGPAVQPTPAQVTTTAAPTTTTPPPPTTTLAPTTTIDQRAKVIADFKRIQKSFNSCLADPARCDVSTVAAAGTQRHTDLSEFFAKLDSYGLRGKPSDQDYTVFEEIQVGNDGAAARLRTCIVDAGVIYDTRGNTDPTDDVVVNDALASTRMIWRLQLTSAGWREATTELLSRTVGAITCPPRGS